MNVEKQIAEAASALMKELFGAELSPSDILVNETNASFDGDRTVVTFPLAKAAKKSPPEVADILGKGLSEKLDFVDGFNVIKGFLNLEFSESTWPTVYQAITENQNHGQHPSNGKKIVLEYCGPNTNKPLHLGHLRNMVIGHSVAAILEKAGNKVHKVNIYNDRGSNISKSMLAWEKFGNGETPESAQQKGDHFVGKYYVRFNTELDKQIKDAVAGGADIKDAKRNAPILDEVQTMTQQWEAGDKEIHATWQKMNDWVYDGFEKTFDRLGVNFEKHYKESEYYKKGKEIVETGLSDGHFKKNADGSVSVDLTEQGLDEKTLLRSDGTSLYLTQDFGIANERYKDYEMDQSIYVVGDEQIYHFKALKESLKLLGKPYGESIFHLSYGMVDLPSGKMKSREGKSVDCDDLMDDMIIEAEKESIKAGKVNDYSEEQKTAIYKTLGIGALKYFILRVNPKKRMVFNPQESIDLQGFTAPFVQYAHARIQSIIRKYGKDPVLPSPLPAFSEREKHLVQLLYSYPRIIAEAANTYDPSVIAKYVFELAKSFNGFYADHSILGNEDEAVNDFRVHLSAKTAATIKDGMHLLGINVPDKM